MCTRYGFSRYPGPKDRETRAGIKGGTLMMIQSSLAVPAAEVRTYQPQSAAPQSAQSASKTEASAARRFDSVTIRADQGRQSPYALELRGKISQEVRTATSSGRIAELREQVLSGTYQVNPAAIARKMLLLGV